MVLPMRFYTPYTYTKVIICKRQR